MPPFILLESYFSTFNRIIAVSLIAVIYGVGIFGPNADLLNHPLRALFYSLMAVIIFLDQRLIRSVHKNAYLYLIQPYSIGIFILLNDAFIANGAHLWLFATSPIFFYRLSKNHAVLFCVAALASAATIQASIWHTPYHVIFRMVVSGLFLTGCLSFFAGKLVAIIKELEQTQTDLKTSLDAMEHGFLILDGKQNIKIFNSQVKKLLNFSDLDLANHPNLHDLVALQKSRGDFGEDYDLVDSTGTDYIKNFDFESNSAPPTRYKRKTIDGRYLEVETWPTKNGDIVRTYKDITDSEITNAQLKVLISEYNQLRSVENQKSRERLIDALSRLAMFRDNETGKHIERTQLYVQVLAESLLENGVYLEQLSKSAISLMVKAAPMHDLGKVGIPDNILLKPGRHTSDETIIMKTHAAIGEATLLAAASENDSNSDLLIFAAKIAGGHHENWDGSGYPRGLRGETIPLPARIMAVADVYDALTTPRVYKRAWSHEDATSEILKLKGTKFDPAVVDAFQQNLNKFSQIAENLRDDEPHA